MLCFKITFVALVTAIFLIGALSLYGNGNNNMPNVLPSQPVLFSEVALSRPVHGVAVVDSIHRLLTAKKGKARLAVLNELTQWYFWQSLDRARAYQREALALAQVEHDSIEYANALLNGANIQRLTSNGDFGYAELIKSLEIFRRIHHTRGIAFAEYYLGLIFWQRGEMLAARTSFLESLQLADSLGDIFLAGRVNNAISEDYLEEGETDKALDFSLRSLALHKRDSISTFSNFALLIQLNNVGEVYRTRGDFINALKYYREGHSLILAHGWRFWHRMANSCGNIAHTYRQMGKYEEAILWAKRAVFEEYGNMQRVPDTLLGRGAFVGSAFGALAYTYRDAGKTDSALYYFRNIFGLPGTEDAWLVVIANAITELHLQRGELREALVYAQRAHRLAEKLGTLKEKIIAAKAMASVLSAAKQFDTAFVYASLYALLQDSLRGVEKIKERERIQARFDFTMKQKENALLKQDNEMKDLVISRQVTLVIGVFAFATVVLLLSGMIFRANARNKRMWLRVQEVNRYLEETRKELLETNFSLQQSNEALNVLNKEKNEMLGIVSHDLKNPIAIIRGFAELMQGGFLESKADIQHASEQIVTTSNRMMGLVGNLLDINMLESQGLQYNFISLELYSFLKSIVEQFYVDASHKDITLHLTEETYNVMVIADELALMQVLENLVSNSVKYSPYGKNIFIRVSANSESGRVEIQDEGPGISEEDMKKLFGKFARLSARPTGGEHSTGLGLSIVKKMVEAMNGRVWCESELGKGATFIVELPKA